MKSYLKKLEDQIRLRADKAALCDYGGECYTYAQLAEQVEKFHIFFQAAGIRKGDKIALCAQNSAQWAIAFLAVNTYEAVIVPILPNYTPEGLFQLIRHSDSVFLMGDVLLVGGRRDRHIFVFRYDQPSAGGVRDHVDGISQVFACGNAAWKIGNTGEIPVALPGWRQNGGISVLHICSSL